MNEIKFYNSNLGCMKVSFKDNYEESDDNTHNYIESITYNFKKSYFISEDNKLIPIFEEFCKTAIKFSSLYPMVLGENVVCKILMNDIINNSNYSLEFWKKESHNAVTVEEFLLSQINIHTIEGLRRNPNNGVVKFLWTVRAINFIYNLIENVILRSEENLYTSILDAYNHSLKPYHGFVKFGIAMMAFKLAPKKSQLISSLGFPNTEFGLNHLRKFMSVAKPCIIEINSLIDKHGCNFPDKV